LQSLQPNDYKTGTGSANGTDGNSACNFQKGVAVIGLPGDVSELDAEEAVTSIKFSEQILLFVLQMKS
jgi:hypothetical protein